MNFTHYTQEQFDVDILQLAKDVVQTSNWEPDLIVGLSRGGLIPAVFLSHYLRVQMTALDWGRDPSLRACDISIPEAIMHSGINVLVVDDIVDSGETLSALFEDWQKAVREPLNTQNIRVAAMYNNTDINEIYTNLTGSIICNYFSRKISRSLDDSWVQFWWEKDGLRN